MQGIAFLPETSLMLNPDESPQEKVNKQIPAKMNLYNKLTNLILIQFHLKGTSLLIAFGIFNTI
jgi:hypothetical protein